MSGAVEGGPAAEARRLLADSGIAADVRAAGASGDIAAVRAGVDQLMAVRRLAPEIKALGFRYVALDLTPGTET